jgi:hypothetical protein
MIVCFGMQLTTVTANENALPQIRLDGGLLLCSSRLGPRSVLWDLWYRKCQLYRVYSEYHGVFL